MRHSLLLPCLLLLLQVPFAAQEIEDDGPFPTGFLDVTFPGGSSPNIPGRVYYPALSTGNGTTPDPASGPYPLVGFMHGWLGTPSSYDLLSQHIASYGFVVASIGSQTGFFGTMQPMAQDTADMLNWLDGESDNPTSFYTGLISDDDWSATGHSMGGGALFYLIEDEPRVRTLVAMEPWKGTSLGGSAGGSQNLTGFTGDVLILGGSEDTTCPVSSMTFPYYELATLAPRAMHVEVLGMGHLGPTDTCPPGNTLPCSEQHRLHRRFVTGLLRAEVKGEQELYVDLLGEGATIEPVALDVRSSDGIHWAATSELAADSSVFGFGGVDGDTAFVLASLAPASIPTAFGLLGIDLAQASILFQTLLGPDGRFEGLFATPAGLSMAAVYSQVFVIGSNGGYLTDVATLSLP